MQSLQILLQKIELIESANPEQANELSTELLSQSRQNGAVKFQVKALRHLAVCAKAMGLLSDAEEYAREAIEIADGQNFQWDLLLSINTLAGIILLQGKHTQALELLESYLQQASRPGFAPEQARFLNNLGVVNELLGNHATALKYYLESIDLLQKLSNSKTLAFSLHNIANIYLRLEMYPESVTYNQDALSMLEELGEIQGQAIVLNGLGELAYLQGDMAESEALHARSISIAREIGNYRELADSLVQRVKCWNIPIKEGLAKDMLDEALQLCENSGEKLMHSEVMLQYAHLYLVQGNTQQALDALQQAKSLTEFIESNEQLCKVYKLFSEAYEKSGNLKDAFHYLSLYTELREEIKGVLVSQKIQAIKFSFELRAAQAEAELLRLRNQELEALSHSDHLTGLANRCHLQQEMELLWQQGALSVLIMDIDYFKQINDHFSYSVGDLVLKKCGEILRQHCSETGLAARFDGEKFVLLLPQVDLDQAISVAEKLRFAFESRNWEQEAEKLKVTVSIGVAHSSEENNVNSILQLADSRLYHAKRSGRNKTVPGVTHEFF